MRVPRILCVDTTCVEASRRSTYRALARRGAFEVHLMVPECWQEQGEIIPAQPEESSGVFLHTSKTFFGFRQHRVVFCSLPALVRELHPDIVYVETEPENYAAMQTRLAIRCLSPQSRFALVSCRNQDYLTIGFPYRFAATHRWCESTCRAAPAHLLFVRSAEGVPLIEGCGKQTVQLPYSVDCTAFMPTGVESMRGSADEITIGYLGRLVESKGLFVLMDAFAALPSAARLLIVGKGPLRDDLQSRAKEGGFINRVALLPPVPYDRVPAVLRRMDVLVLPSLETRYWKEQFGRVLIEAMACGVPIVGSRCGSIPETLGHAGVLFRTGDVADLKAVLMILMQDPMLRCRLAKLGRERALGKYDSSVVASILEQAFLDVLGVRPTVETGHENP
jgi:glycosyltransferase involved in cell wall biosynthesis